MSELTRPHEILVYNGREWVEVGKCGCYCKNCRKWYPYNNCGSSECKYCGYPEEDFYCRDWEIKKND